MSALDRRTDDVGEHRAHHAKLSLAPRFESADPDDHEARFELAAAKMAAGDRNSAADALLEIIRRDLEWNEGAARQRLLPTAAPFGERVSWIPLVAVSQRAWPQMTRGDGSHPA